MARAAQYQGSVSSDVVAGGTEIVALNGEFDLSNSADFERRLSEASEPEPTDILVDLRGVSFVDSTTLEVVVRGVARANGARHRLRADSTKRSRLEGVRSDRAQRPLSELLLVTRGPVRALTPAPDATSQLGREGPLSGARGPHPG